MCLIPAARGACGKGVVGSAASLSTGEVVAGSGPADAHGAGQGGGLPATPPGGPMPLVGAAVPHPCLVCVWGVFLGLCVLP